MKLTRGRNGSDDGDRALAFRVSETLDSTGTFVERGQPGAEVSGVAGIGRHLGQTTRNFSQGFGPTRRGVGHHGDVVAHVSEVLGEGDAGVDGGLSSGDRHVGGVGHEGSSPHDGLGLAVDLDGQFREISEYLGHLVSSLAAADVDDDVGVGVLGQRLRDDSLAAAEGA